MDIDSSEKATHIPCIMPVDTRPRRNTHYVKAQDEMRTCTTSAPRASEKLFFRVRGSGSAYAFWEASKVEGETGHQKDEAD